MNQAKGCTPKTVALRAAICTLLDASPDGVSVAELTHRFGMGISGMEKHVTALHAEGRAMWAQVSTTRRWASPQHYAHVVEIGRAIKAASAKACVARRKVRDALRERKAEMPPVAAKPKPERVKPLRLKRTRDWPDATAWTAPAPLIPSIWHLAQRIGQEAP